MRITYLMYIMWLRSGSARRRPWGRLAPQQHDRPMVWKRCSWTYVAQCLVTMLKRNDVVDMRALFPYEREPEVLA
jgi:hypothetical protein